MDVALMFYGEYFGSSDYGWPSVHAHAYPNIWWRIAVSFLGLN